jgi:hypothetical protein
VLSKLGYADANKIYQRLIRDWGPGRSIGRLSAAGGAGEQVHPARSQRLLCTDCGDYEATPRSMDQDCVSDGTKRRPQPAISPRVKSSV